MSESSFCVLCFSEKIFVVSNQILIEPDLVLFSSKVEPNFFGEKNSESHKNPDGEIIMNHYFNFLFQIDFGIHKDSSQYHYKNALNFISSKTFLNPPISREFGET